MKQLIIFLFIWLLLAIIGYGIGSLVFNTSDLQHFTDKGNPIYGKVTAKEPDNHQAVHYIYNVDGKEYSGIGNAERGNPSFEQTQIGQQVVVFYDPETPEKSILGYPQFYAKTNNFGILFVTIFFPVFPMLTLYSAYRLFIYKKSSQN